MGKNVKLFCDFMLKNKCLMHYALKLTRIYRRNDQQWVKGLFCDFYKAHCLCYAEMTHEYCS